MGFNFLRAFEKACFVTFLTPKSSVKLLISIWRVLRTRLIINNVSRWNVSTLSRVKADPWNLDKFSKASFWRNCLMCSSIIPHFFSLVTPRIPVLLFLYSCQKSKVYPQKVNELEPFGLSWWHWASPTLFTRFYFLEYIQSLT